MIYRTTEGKEIFRNPNLTDEEFFKETVVRELGGDFLDLWEELQNPIAGDNYELVADELQQELCYVGDELEEIIRICKDARVKKLLHSLVVDISNFF
jgi:hypothetical protein